MKKSTAKKPARKKSPKSSISITIGAERNSVPENAGILIADIPAFAPLIRFMEACRSVETDEGEKVMVIPAPELRAIMIDHPYIYRMINATISPAALSTVIDPDPEGNKDKGYEYYSQLEDQMTFYDRVSDEDTKRHARYLKAATRLDQDNGPVKDGHVALPQSSTDISWLMDIVIGLADSHVHDDTGVTFQIGEVSFRLDWIESISDRENPFDGIVTNALVHSEPENPQ